MVSEPLAPRAEAGGGAVTDATREAIEKIVWEIVPDLAEAIIREEIQKLLREQAGR
jgi:pyruvate/oxaloacetate carboxyltransferase